MPTMSDIRADAERLGFGAMNVKQTLSYIVLLGDERELLFAQDWLIAMTQEYGKWHWGFAPNEDILQFAASFLGIIHAELDALAKLEKKQARLRAKQAKENQA